jgi:hypothetical protein
MCVSDRVNTIFNNIKDSTYTGDLWCQHFAVGIRKGKIITPIMCNYNRTIVFGKISGSIHAEMNVINYLLNTNRIYKCLKGGYNKSYI